MLADASTSFAHPAIEAGFAELIPAARELGGLARLPKLLQLQRSRPPHRALAAEGLVGLDFTNAPASIAPVAGHIPVIGTDPFSVAVPDGPVSFLLSTSERCPDGTEQV